MALLILVRHALSDWNKEGKWQGKIDRPLSMEGREQAASAAESLKSQTIDEVYTSTQIRTKETWEEMQKVLKTFLPISTSDKLNERDYGIYTARNKWEVKKEIGEVKFERLRRGWDTPIPQGETIEMVYDRVVPFYQGNILPKLKAGKNILVITSGNTERALAKYLENLSVEQVEKLEIKFTEVRFYEVDNNGNVIGMKIRFPGFTGTVSSETGE